MKVVYVIDSISKLENKIINLTNHFGNDIMYVVKADLVDLFKTYEHQIHAIYYNNLSSVIHSLLSKSNLDDVVVCYSSLEFDTKLFNNFKNKIGDKKKVVNVIPKENFLEKMCDCVYNIYVKSLFKVKDSFASPKLQFLPKEFVIQLIDSHFGNRLFELSEAHVTNLYIEDEPVNSSLKIKTKPAKYNIISLIIALVLTIGLLACIAFTKIHYIVILVFIICYLLDLILVIIFQSKAKFDQRFLK